MSRRKRLLAAFFMAMSSNMAPDFVKHTPEDKRAKRVKKHHKMTGEPYMIKGHSFCPGCFKPGKSPDGTKELHLAKYNKKNVLLCYNCYGYIVLEEIKNDQGNGEISGSDSNQELQDERSVLEKEIQKV